MFHMTPDGPKKCVASDRSKCRYSGNLHGTEQEVEHQYTSDLTAIHDLKHELLKASQDYYQDLSDSGLSDEEYDDKLEYLRNLAQSYNIEDDELDGLLEGAVASGTSSNTSSDESVHHDVPMLSLEKAKTREAVESYLNRMVDEGATGFKLQAKLDGIACSAIYEHGQLAKMSTRGNGDTGEDMSYLIDSPDVTLKGLPKHLKGKLSDSNVEIRGELFLRNSDFKAADEQRAKEQGEHFANYRNANAGIVKKSKKGLGYKASLSFIMYKIVGSTKEQDLIDGGVDEVSQMTANEWDKTGDTRPDELSVTGDNLADKAMKIVDEFGPVRSDLDIPTDGIVIKPLNEKEMDDKLGHNAHHPLSQIAFKYPGAKARVKITGVEWSVGKSGRLTPTLTYEHTNFGGSWNSRATLHNTGMLDANDIRVGSMAVVEKANDVIPYFGGVVYTNDDAKRITPPKTCPSCGGVLKSGDKLTYCMNPDCPSKNEYVLRAAAAKGVLNFDGMSTKYIDALQDAGLVNDVADFYHLSEEELTNVVVGQSKDGGDRHIGATRAKHIMSFIEASKELPFHKVLSSLAVQDLGGQTSKLLANHYQDVDAIMNASTQELSDIPGIGEKKAVNIKNGLNARKPLIKKMKDAGLNFAKTESKKTLKDSSEEKVKSHIEGKNFSISGAVPEGYANRPEWQEFIEAMGGKAQGTPNKDTDFMIGNPNDTHGKIQKAIKLGVTIISPEEFNEMIHS